MARGMYGTVRGRPAEAPQYTLYSPNTRKRPSYAMTLHLVLLSELFFIFFFLFRRCDFGRNQRRNDIVIEMSV